MKKMILITFFIACFYVEAVSQNVGEVKTGNSYMTRSGDYMAVSIDMLLDSLDVRNSRAYLITPSIVNGDNVLALHPVGVYSFDRWYYYKRSGEFMLGGSAEISYRDNAVPDFLAYEEVVPYSEWMDGSELVLTLEEYGCCRKILESWKEPVARYDGPYMPPFHYVAPEVEKHKYRRIYGSAYVDFPVNETVIYPEYRNNTHELAKIRSTLDDVFGDSDVAIKSVSIKGFASPESSYENNRRLASGRTEALKKYIHDLYDFPNDLIKTDFVPENWIGLREFVEASDLAHKADILAIIDSDRDPDNKEWKIKSVYKDEYQYLLKNIYPALRRSDYLIEYEVRSYTDVEEIARIVYVKPQNLSLDELYAYAQELDKESEEFAEVFETAVRMFPDDETANLNAANTALGRGEMRKALRYLDKAGNSAEACYARGVYEYKLGNLDEALALFVEAREKGMAAATLPIEKINEMKEIAAKYQINK